MGIREQAVEGLKSGLYETITEAANSLGTSKQYVSRMWNEHLAKTGQKKPKEEFDPQLYMQDNLEKIFKKLTATIAQKGSAKHIEMALKLMGLLVEKREDTHKFELTPTDYADVGRTTIDGLRADLEQFGGICPVCFQPKTIRIVACDDSRPKFSEDCEVGTVAVSARPA